METWQNILGKGLICRETIDSELRQTSFFADEKPQWLQLRDWRILNDDQFISLSKTVWEQYKEREFSVHFAEFLGVTRLLIFLEKKELMGFLGNASVIQEACNYIDFLAESGFPETWLAGEALERVSSPLLEPEGDSAVFVRLLIDKLTQARKECFSGWTRELLELITDEGIGEFRTLVYSRGRFGQFPSLCNLDCDEVAERFASLNFTSRRIFAASLEDRYQSGESSEETLAEEKTWLQRLDDSLKSEEEKRKGRVSGDSIREFRSEYLAQILESANGRVLPATSGTPTDHSPQ